MSVNGSIPCEVSQVTDVLKDINKVLDTINRKLYKRVSFQLTKPWSIAENQTLIINVMVNLDDTSEFYLRIEEIDNYFGWNTGKYIDIKCDESSVNEAVQHIITGEIPLWYKAPLEHLKEKYGYIRESHPTEHMRKLYACITV
jgi:tetrahydromethanopterin S-methyltransferase subunit G